MPDNPRSARMLGTPQWLFLLFLLAVATAYTVLGARLSRRTGSGAMGPGYVPLWLGLAAIGGVVAALVMAATVRRVARPKTRVTGMPAEPGAAPPPTGTLSTLGVVLGGFTCLVVGFAVLGSLVSVVLFVVGMLWYLNRHLVWWVWGVSITVAVGFWFLFHVLGVDLPRGLLL